MANKVVCVITLPRVQVWHGWNVVCWCGMTWRLLLYTCHLVGPYPLL